MSNIEEIQVFRLLLQEGRYYKTTILTREVGKWPNKKYYSTNQLKYVGKFVKNILYGYHDDTELVSVFDNNGIEEYVRYADDGTTSFVETFPIINHELNFELIEKYNNKKIPKLSDIAKRYLSTEEIRISREYNFF